MTQTHDTTRQTFWGLLLLALLGAGLVLPPLALADSTSRATPPARYRGPANEVSGGLSSLLMPRPIGNADERSYDDWARWEFWFEYEKDALLRDAHVRLVNAAEQERRITGSITPKDELTAADRQQRVLPALRKALEDRNLFVRSAATLAAANAGDRESLPMLVHRLHSRNAVERRSAALSLGFLGSDVAVGPLSERLKTDRDVTVRSFSALALGLIGDKDSAPVLRSALERSLRSVGREHREFQVALVNALGH
ncbi:MAG: HEAT repeat domain-containing protein, partial [Planctomycetota bacterium]